MNLVYYLVVVIVNIDFSDHITTMCERQCYIFVKSRPGDKDQTKLHYMFDKLRRGIELINIKRIYLYDTDQNRTEIHTR